MEKLIALIIIVVIMATAIVPYVIGTIKSFQAYIPIGVIAVIIPPVGTIIGWCEILGYPMATKAAQIFNKCLVRFDTHSESYVKTDKKSKK